MEKKQTSFRWTEIEPLCLLRLLARKWWLIVMAALIGAMLTTVVLESLVSRQYSSTVTFAVTARASDSTFYSNVSTAGEVAAIYSQLLQSDMMSVAVHESLGGVPGSISATQLGDTNLINVTVTSESPKNALRLVQAVMENYADISEYVSSMAVLSPLDAPTVAVKVSRVFNTRQLSLMAAAICGAAMCAVLVFLSLIAGTIHNREGAKNHLDSRIIASIPHEKDAARRAQLAKGIRTGADGLSKLLGLQEGGSVKESLRRLFGVKQGRRVRNDLKISSPAISFAFAESIHRVAAQFEHEQAKGRKVFLFSSVSEAEGKSTLAANTALSLTEKKGKVLFIDLDLRRPVQNQLLGLNVSNRGELGDLLAKGAPASRILEAAVVEPNSGLHSLLSSQSYTDMIELISSPALAKLLALARKEFDYVIIDSPPLGYFADSELLSDLSDASVLVVRQDTVPAGEINDAIDALSAGKAAFLGCILNDMRYLHTRSGGYGYGYGYGYGKYGKYGKYEKYGYGSSKSQSK